MKTLKAIAASILFCSVFFTPVDDAPLSTFLLWFAFEISAIYGLHRLMQSEEKEA